jgi:hypothetical protein
MVASLNKSVTATRESTFPYLWVSNIIAAQPIASAFHLLSPAVPSTEIPVGYHILCFDPDTPEVVIKAIAYDLLDAGSQVEIYELGQRLEWLINDESAIQMAVQILEFKRSYQDWARSLGDTPLDPGDAINLAKLALVKIQNKNQLNAELERLRVRAGVSGFDWNKKYLDPLKSELGIASEISLEELSRKLDALVARGISGSALTKEVNQLALASALHVSEVRKLHADRVEEIDLDLDREDNRAETENLLKLSDKSLSLDDYLPIELAKPLTTWCDWMSIRPEVILTALLAGASSLHKVGTELVVHRNQNFRTPPTIFAALVSESGQRKSPIFSNIIRYPLQILRREKLDAYAAAMQDYEAALMRWEQSEKKGEKPKPPKDPSLYCFTNATGEAIPIQASKDPQKALLGLVDELSGLFNSANSYRSGRGSDKQDLLSYFDGMGQTVLRAGGIKVDLENIYLSIFGTIQPAVLKNYMADCSDPDGQWARFLFVNQPLAAAKLPDDDGQAIQVHQQIADFYRKIDQLPEMEYRLSSSAFQRYQRIYDQLEQMRCSHPKPGMRAVFAKMEGYMGRLALNLHVLWELAAGKKCPDEEIPLFIMEMAIDLTKFYIDQVKLIHAHSDDEELAPNLLKLIELSKRLEKNKRDGWVKSKQYQDTFPKKKRPSAQQLRIFMMEAVRLGQGKVRGSGNRLEFHWRSDISTPPNPPTSLGNLKNLAEDLGNTLPQPESFANQVIESNLGNLRNTPSLITPTDFSMNYTEPESDSISEGGSVPQCSATLSQEVPDVELECDSELGNTSPNPSSALPQVSPSDENFCDCDGVELALDDVVDHTKAGKKGGVVKKIYLAKHEGRTFPVAKVKWSGSEKLEEFPSE